MYDSETIPQEQIQGRTGQGGHSMNIATSHEELKQLIGVNLGVAGPVIITQSMINQFADATDDHQGIHVDPDAAVAAGMATTIAHGYLISALGPSLLPQLLEVTGFTHALNIGSDRIRYTAMVPVDSKLMATAVIEDVADKNNASQVTVKIIYFIEKPDEPSCVANVIYRYIWPS